MPALALAFMLLLVTLHLLGRIPVFVLMIYIIVSLITFFIFGLDKYAASRQKRRIPEITLQQLALFGGWPGAVLAQNAFRHKRKKGSFMATFHMMCLINAGVLVGWLVLR